VAGKLRAVLFIVLGGGMIAVAVTLLVGLHLHSFLPERTKPNPVKTPRPTPSASAPGAQAAGTFHLPLTALLYGLLIVLLIAAVVVSIWWARRLRPPAAARPDGLIVEDPESLREAVESGRTALRALDDARAAIIACYLAMEASLAQRGAARGVAGTPDELLARATGQGLVRGAADRAVLRGQVLQPPAGPRPARRRRAGARRAGRGARRRRERDTCNTLTRSR
jgi:hypothetical protein